MPLSLPHRPPHDCFTGQDFPKLKSLFDIKENSTSVELAVPLISACPCKVSVVDVEQPFFYLIFHFFKTSTTMKKNLIKTQIGFGLIVNQTMPKGNSNGTDNVPDTTFLEADFERLGILGELMRFFDDTQTDTTVNDFLTLLQSIHDNQAHKTNEAIFRGASKLLWLIDRSQQLTACNRILKPSKSLAA